MRAVVVELQLYGFFMTNLYVLEFFLQIYRVSKKVNSFEKAKIGVETR